MAGNVWNVVGRGNSRLTPEKRDGIAKDYEAGCSIASLAKKFGITKKNVKGLIRARGIEIRPYIPIPRRPRKYRASPVPVHEKWATKHLEMAKRRGEIVAPDKCSVCGKSGKVHGHHDDYNKPLEVRWLCPSCHVDWHSKNIPVPCRRSSEPQEVPNG